MSSEKETKNGIKGKPAKTFGFLFWVAAGFLIALALFLLGVAHERAQQATKPMRCAIKEAEKSLQASTPPNQLIEPAIDQARAGEISGLLARVTDAKREKDQGELLKSATKQIMGIILTDPEVEKMMTEVYWREILLGKTENDATKEMLADFDVLVLIMKKVRHSDLSTEISEDQVRELAILTRDWLADNYSRFLTAKP